ncbi:MAG TPA: NAD-dependent epimerase/dehydratase family protein, partial [Candidatus Nanoarchaeia archaeon]|nr:NAD-dependent epimerase/dehydratase family protein [Candidatus Nanoarchaeia archaeon]
MKKTRVLVTGANGFLGSHIVDSLKSQYSVSVLVRDKTYRRTGIAAYYFNSYSDTAIEAAVSGADVIVHAASMIHGPRFAAYRDANVRLTKTIVDSAKEHKVKHIIYISSENVNHPQLNDNYTKTKREAEQEVKKFKNNTILRPTIIYGGNDKRYVGKLISVVKHLPFVPVLGSGKNLFQFVYIDDVISIIKSSIKNKIYGIYVVAGPDVISYSDFVKLLMDKLHVKKPLVPLSIRLLKPFSHVLDKLFSRPLLTP